MTTGEGRTSSRERQLQLGAGVISVGSALAAVLTVALSLGRWWVEPPPSASLAGVTSTVVEPPGALTAGEAYVLTRTLPTGELHVTHWIESRQLMFRLELTLPQVADAEGLTADQVRVVADDRAAAGPDQIRSGGSSLYSFLGAKSLQINYRLTHAVARSASAPGRALAQISALDATYDPPSRRVTRAVTAPDVLSLACAPPAVESTPAPCGSRAAAGVWTVELTGSRVTERVIAQLSLE